MTTVLLIEDEETSRELTVIALQRLGITDIVLAEDGKKAIKVLDGLATKPDVVISDIMMPNKDGVEIVSALVARKFQGGLILLSGADPNILRMTTTMAAHGGVNVLATLIKPLDEKALKYAFDRLN
ncbi:MAG TPA: response regulator [Burkholderiaceae bacterium]|nr:response regulator [Burkholderiaceae bacterium]